MEEEIMMSEMPEESVEDKIAGAKAQIAQMERMIVAKREAIERGEDKVAHEYMINALTESIKEEWAKIEKLTEEK